MIIKNNKVLMFTCSVVIMIAVLFWPADEASLSKSVIEQSKAQLEKTNSQIKITEIKDTVASTSAKQALPMLSVEQGMQHEMQRVADIYEQRSQYAPYSLYLSPEQTDLINPNQSHESPRAYDVDGEQISVLIKPRNYRFAKSDKVLADIVIKSSAQGLDSITQLTLGITSLVSKQSWSMTTSKDIKEKGTRAIVAEFDPSSQLDRFLDEDYSLVVKVDFNGEPGVIQSAPIKIVATVAEVTGISSQSIEDNDLIIPITIKAEKSGYYQFSASLFDVKSNSAISFVIAKQYLNSGLSTMKAKVQGLLLRDKGFSGPFRLQGITLVKKSERPGLAEEYGLAADSYLVEAVDLNDFESIPYEDPMTEQRLEFMRSIGQ
jgi:hypothetical protein